MKNIINKNGFIQIAIVVRDIEKAATKWSELLGMEMPTIKVMSPKEDPDLTYRGKPAFYGLKVTNIQMNGFVIELHEPDTHDSTFKEFLIKHGNGVHHLGFEVGDERDAIVDELQKDGYDLRTVGYYPGSSWTIVDTEDDLGVNLNIKPHR